MLDLLDIMFLVKCLQNKEEDDNFNLFDYIKFNESTITRSSGKLVINYSRTSAYTCRHFNLIVLFFSVMLFTLS